jgi:hypothetical protein
MVKGRLGKTGCFADFLNTNRIKSLLGKKLAGGLQDEHSVIVHGNYYTDRYRMCQGIDRS